MFPNIHFWSSIKLFCFVLLQQVLVHYNMEIQISFNEIYNTYGKRVYNLALNYCGNTEDAQEITQDTFVAVYESLDQFRNEAQISTWITRITINKSIDLLRKRKRKRWLSFFDQHPENSLPNFNHPGVELVHREEVEHLFEQLNGLPEQQKTALILTKLEGLKMTEVAAIMGVSSKSVESLVARGKLNLEKKIKPNEG